MPHLNDTHGSMVSTQRSVDSKGLPPMSQTARDKRQAKLREIAEREHGKDLDKKHKIDVFRNKVKEEYEATLTKPARAASRAGSEISHGGRRSSGAASVHSGLGSRGESRSSSVDPYALESSRSRKPDSRSSQKPGSRKGTPGQEGGVKDASRSSTPASQKDADWWHALVLYEAKRAADEASRKEELRKVEQSELRVELNKQVEYKERLRQRELEERMKWDIKEKERNNFLSEVDKKKEEDKKVRDRDLQSKQAEYASIIRHRRDAEKEEQLIEEKRRVKEMQAELEQEKEKDNARKLQEKHRMLKVMMDFEVQIGEKEKTKEKEREFERKMNEEYIKMLDKQDARRVETFNMIYAKQRAQEEAFMESVGDQMKIREKEDEARAIKVQEDFKKRLESQEREKADKKKKVLEEQLKVLASQIENKEKLKEKEALEKVELHRLFVAQQEEFQKEEAMKKNMVKSRNLKLKHDLEEQIASKSKHAQEVLVDMTPQERKLNSNILNRVKETIQPPKVAITAKTLHVLGHQSPESPSKTKGLWATTYGNSYSESALAQGDRPKSIAMATGEKIINS